VKRLFAILFSLLLVWIPFAPVPAAASVLPTCPQHMAGKTCNASCGMAGCCVKKPDSNSQPAPAIPARTSSQNQISLLAPAIAAWTSPANPSNSISSVTALPLMAKDAPLYARNCTRLI
jgi:hypothetical protein